MKVQCVDFSIHAFYHLSVLFFQVTKKVQRGDFLCARMWSMGTFFFINWKKSTQLTFLWAFHHQIGLFYLSVNEKVQCVDFLCVHMWSKMIFLFLDWKSPLYWLFYTSSIISVDFFVYQLMKRVQCGDFFMHTHVIKGNFCLYKLEIIHLFDFSTGFLSSEWTFLSVN